MSTTEQQSVPPPSRWELAAETIAVKIRWFGLLVGYLLINLDDRVAASRPILAAILTLGAAFTLLDTYFSYRKRIFLGGSPLLVSAMEALFIGLLCYYDRGLDSSFRYYYFLSLICCAIRHSPPVTYLTCALHCLSLGVLFLTLPTSRAFPQFVLTLVILGWVTWASNALAMLLKGVGEHLGRLNEALRENKQELEERIEERSRQLQEAQAHVLHQEKMAAFGLLAAGIAHEVGNPLTSISTIVQMLQRQSLDEYVGTKLSLVSGQLQRIRATLRELVEFSRPASSERGYVSLVDLLEESLNIAKYYNRMGAEIVPPKFPDDVPYVFAVRDQLVQVFLNLILNAVDATSEQSARNRQHTGGNGDAMEGTVAIALRVETNHVVVTVKDDGCGIAEAHQEQIFRPYFTTKKHGTGLGLFVTRKLLEDHGGEIRLESEVGRGTTFEIRLPHTEPKHDVETAGRRTNDSTSFSN